MLDLAIFSVLMVAIYASASAVMSILMRLDWIFYGIGLWLIGMLLGCLISLKACIMLAVLWKLLRR